MENLPGLPIYRLGHRSYMQEVLQNFRVANLNLNPKKCALSQKKLETLDHTVSEDGIQISNDKINSFRDWPRPQGKHEVRGLVGVLEVFVKVAAPLQQLTEPKMTCTWVKIDIHLLPV